MPRLLDEIRIASPCPMRWSQMKGDDRVRYCGECRKKVYNLSEIDPDEAERLIRRSEGPICARLYRRRDGTVIAGDCVVGARRLYFRVAASLVATATLVFGTWGGALALRILGTEAMAGGIGALPPVSRQVSGQQAERNRQLKLKELRTFGQDNRP